MTQSLFDKYGGITTFSAVVKLFYQKVLDNEHLSPYFKGIRMERLISHQTNFISNVLGGPDRYDGRDLIAVHADLGISHQHFVEVTELLEEALEESGVENQDVETIINYISTLEEKIVSS